MTMNEQAFIEGFRMAYVAQKAGVSLSRHMMEQQAQACARASQGRGGVLSESDNRVYARVAAGAALTVDEMFKQHAATYREVAAMSEQQRTEYARAMAVKFAHLF